MLSWHCPRVKYSTLTRNSISVRAVRDDLKRQDILVEGLSVDKAPQAYKGIERVMHIQTEEGLIDPVARMRPVAVIMAGEKGDD